MKMRFLFVLMLMLSPFASASTFDKDYQELIGYLQTGNFEAALKKQQWFFDSEDPYIGPFRNSFVLSTWAALSEVYEPAQKALAQRLKQAERGLLTDAGSFDQFMEYQSINQSLGRNKQTIALFIKADKQVPELARSYFFAIQSVLIDEGYFEIAAKYIGDPVFAYERVRHNRELELSRIREGQPRNEERALERANSRYLADVKQLIDVMVGVNNYDNAYEIQKRAVGYFDDGQIKAAI